ncbi:MAG: MBL fold metallo-hydrolase [Myxococcota bacterium]
MARATKLPRELREARRRVERAFCAAERAVFGVGDDESLAPDPISWLREQLTALHPGDLAGREMLTRRLRELEGAATEESARTRYREAHGVSEVTCTRSSGGARIYRVVATTFPGHENYVYLVVSDAGVILFDVGSGPHSREEILRGLTVVQRVWGERVALADVKVVFISHAHIDHFGDAAFFRQATGGRLMVHELDARVLTRFEERRVVAAKDMAVFLARAGLGLNERERLERMYLRGKGGFEGVEVDRRLRSGDRILGRYEVIHTPGHCPGHLCLRVDNVLLVADQVLDPITPNLSPQHLTSFNGLESYLGSLFKLRTLEGIEHVLPAHANPIPSLSARIDQIIEHHQERLMAVLEACTQRPRVLAEIAEVLYGRQEEYNVILALTEAGAHVEYLHQYGRLRIANLDAVREQRDPVLEYVTD